jgi:hypothetical protein
VARQTFSGAEGEVPATGRTVKRKIAQREKTVDELPPWAFLDCRTQLAYP